MLLASTVKLCWNDLRVSYFFAGSLDILFAKIMLCSNLIFAAQSHLVVFDSVSYHNELLLFNWWLELDIELSELVLNLDRFLVGRL